MIFKIVSYRVKREKLSLIKKAIRNFVQAVGKEKGTMLYDAYQEIEDPIVLDTYRGIQRCRSRKNTSQYRAY